MSQIQIFLLVLIMGFLTGPQVIDALQRLTPENPNSPNAAGIVGASEATNVAEALPRESSDPYSTLSLQAKSVYVWDIAEHRKLYGQNEHNALPLASVAKMMMALVATELLPADTKITIAPVDLSEEGDSGLYAGEKWRLSDLLQFTLVASSNDGASAIASVVGASLERGATTSDPFRNKKMFIAEMNEKARVIGLLNTHFSSESGLDLSSVTSGAYGSARDMAILFEYIYRKHPDLFSPTSYESLDLTSDSKITHHVANTNEGVAHITGLLASKTGYTELAGGNLVVVVDVGIGHPIAIAVLGSTRDGRFTDVEKLISATVHKITGATSASTTAP